MPLTNSLLAEEITHDIDLSRYDTIVNPTYVSRITPGLKGTPGALRVDERRNDLTYAEAMFPQQLLQFSLWGLRLDIDDTNLVQRNNKRADIIRAFDYDDRQVLLIATEKSSGDIYSVIEWEHDDFSTGSHSTQLTKNKYQIDIQFTNTGLEILTPSLATYPGLQGSKPGLKYIQIGFVSPVVKNINGFMLFDEVNIYNNDDTITTINSLASSAANSQHHSFIYKKILNG